MSKITKALEKAARERVQQRSQQPTVTTAPVVVPIATSRLGDMVEAGEVKIDPHIVSATAAESPIAEQYRILRTNLQSLRLRAGCKVFAVTSAVNDEGKSVTALNLALTFARQGELKVALVDCDMRKSSIHAWLGLGERPAGTSTVLANGGDLDGACVKLQDPQLAVLPGGPIPQYPAELLESAAMKRMLAILRREFDIVILDTPPVLLVADPGIIASQVDGVLLVVRSGKTQRRTVAQAQVLLKQAKANILGTVLTHMEYYLPGYFRYYHTYRYGQSENGNGKSDDNRAGQVTSRPKAVPA